MLKIVKQRGLHYHKLRKCCFSIEINKYRGSLFGIGNPLIDYVINLESSEFESIIKHHKLKKNIPQIANLNQMNLFDLITKPHLSPIITAGGATQNTIRIAQWLLKTPQSTTFVGAIGNDDKSENLKSLLIKEGVHVCYQRYNERDTGKCLIFISGKDRILLSDLGASVMLNDNILDNTDISERFDMSQFVYLEGFLWLTNPSLMISLMKKIQNSNKILATNLHAEFLSAYLIESEFNVLENIDILFGNQSEALSLARTIASCARLKSVRDKFSEFLNFPVIGTDGLARLAILLSQMSRKNSKSPRIIVFTQGGKEVVMCLNTDNIQIIKVPTVPSSQITDRTGCGDSFVGGFLAALIAGKTPLDAVQVGIKLSQFILGRHGCSIPSNLRPIIDL